LLRLLHAIARVARRGRAAGDRVEAAGPDQRRGRRAAGQLRADGAADREARAGTARRVVDEGLMGSEPTFLASIDEGVVRRFETAWRGGSGPDVGDFLPPAGPKQATT